MSEEDAAIAGFRPVRSEHLQTAVDVDDLQQSYLPEIAFLGRSNVGKSSLINMLCGRRELARTGQTPGKTQTMNLYRVTFRAGEGDERREVQMALVDLPGFGFAKVAKAMRDRWAQMIDRYLQRRKSLELVVLLVDARREPGDEERRIREAGGPDGVIVALTKADKLARAEVEKSAGRAARLLKLPREHVIPVSTLDSRHSVQRLRDNLLARIVPEEDLYGE